MGSEEDWRRGGLACQLPWALPSPQTGSRFPPGAELSFLGASPTWVGGCLPAVPRLSKPTRPVLSHPESGSLPTWSKVGSQTQVVASQRPSLNTVFTEGGTHDLMVIFMIR